MTRPGDVFFNDTGLERAATQNFVSDALHGCDDGELFLEFCQSESLVFDDGQLKSANFDTMQGFGLRAVTGETTAYAHSSQLDMAALERAKSAVSAVRGAGDVSFASHPEGTNVLLYPDASPVDSVSFDEKAALMQEADSFARSLDERVRQVSISYAGELQQIEIIRPGDFSRRDDRPLIRFNVSIVSGSGERQETGTYGFGGRGTYGELIRRDDWRGAVREALRQSLVNLEARPAPAGEMDVVLGPGWPGILLHEAVGHGLEGDFNRKGSSAFAGLMGEQIAAKGVTVVDDGTLEGRRGSLAIDDEGTPSSCTTLIEDGILVGYMQDRLNGRLTGTGSTGNGRRQSYAHSPIPRMTNTCMLAGPHEHDEIIASVKNGLYAVSFGGGQVDITSGKFVFSCTEAYMIENGKVSYPVKGATIIGNGADALKRISMIGNDMALDPGIGTCGKQGQGVPVGVGQPTIRLDRITVGGTAT
ncbi:MAG TPA: metalloprotease TldD [Rhizobiales bacterium]|nr:metalloprotease TldD [Hyphomicrobiales bacterium]